MKLTLITYGISQFDPKLFQPVKNLFVKPEGGLWASPVNSSYGWIDWCREENFNYQKGFARSFVFCYSGYILTIDCLADLELMPWTTMGLVNWPDFERMDRDGIDAVFLTARGQRETRLSFPRHLYGWDCESVLIMNPAGIRGIKLPTTEN